MQDMSTLHFVEHGVEVYYTIQQACSILRGTLQQQPPLPQSQTDKNSGGTLNFTR